MSEQETYQNIMPWWSALKDLSQEELDKTISETEALVKFFAALGPNTSQSTNYRNKLILLRRLKNGLRCVECSKFTLYGKTCKDACDMEVEK